MEKPAKIRRITVDLLPAEHAELETFCKDRGTAKKAEIRLALKRHYLIERRRASGDTLYMGTADGPKAEVLI
jgi:hypothetical protein